ncbi:carboxypeptidase-like regulatory domain-containing protein [Algoriphagus sp. C2-6-M1]|uniref:carboxypeptidase-like regulatory domain-containing protein n=1 Tax=Algoriphagus persicinus TaxID=3108754 RepID=UPI002B39CF91|nr:carboxypeptidase-like regulatory domain-containing protein [Algoriphagus sp. C2-6-M1]MEB2779592.1 carboxypeptidase-like regulatory domain-containing protein [Algoriphagus sp. C2-6-M1]
MRKLFLLVFFFAVGSIAAQTVSGVVREKATGLPLPFANVFVNNTTQGIATDSEGKFSLSGDFPSQIELVASFMGYMTEVKSVSFEGQNQAEVIFELSFNESNLSEIELKAKRDKSWERKFKKFEEVFLAVPDDPFKSQIEILNPWVLEFDKVKSDQGPNYLQASAQEPLKITNWALGYRMNYYLQDFRLLRNGSRYFGQVHYEPLTPIDTQEELSWEYARQVNYHSSLRKLNQSILLNSPDSVYFSLFKTLPDQTNRRKTNDFSVELNQSIFPIQKDSILRRPLGDGNFRIFLTDRLEIHHIDKPWPNDYYTNIHHPISWIEAPEGFYNIDRNGTLLNPTQLVLSGYLGRQRVARTLPLDFVPQSEFQAGDTRSEEIITGPNTELNRFREKVWLTTNKSYFYPRETAWIGGHMLYQDAFLADSLSRVVHVDIIRENFEVVQSATFPIRQGRIEGGLVLPKEMKPGDYAIRAYTSWKLNFPEADQFIAPFLVMEEGFRPEVGTTESEIFPDAIAIKSDFTIVDSLSYRVMDLEFNLIDEFENPIDGEFVLSITDADQVVDMNQGIRLEQAMNWLDEDLPETYKSSLSYPVEYGISIQGKFTPDNKRQGLVNPITIVRGDLEDYGQVMTDSSGYFWATGLNYQDTAQIAVAAVNDKLRPFGSVELIPMDKPVLGTNYPKLAYRKVAVPSEDYFLDISGDYILLEEFVKEGVKVEDERSQWFGYGEPDRVMSKDQLSMSLNMMNVLQRMGFNSTNYRLGNFNVGQRTGAPLLIIDGAPYPFLENQEFKEIIESYQPQELESVGIYTFSSSVFGMAGYAGVVVLNTKRGQRYSKNPNKKFNSEGFQFFSIPGFTTFPEFPKNPPADQYLRKKPTIYWEPKAKTSNGVFQVNVKVPYGIDRLRIQVEGRSLDGEAIYKVIQLER